MTKLSMDMSLKNCAVTLEFYWYGEEPDWQTMEVYALLPAKTTPEGKHWVLINDLLDDEDWDTISANIYWREDELMQQLKNGDY